MKQIFFKAPDGGMSSDDYAAKLEKTLAEMDWDSVLTADPTQTRLGVRVVVKVESDTGHSKPYYIVHRRMEPFYLGDFRNVCPENVDAVTYQDFSARIEHLKQHVAQSYTGLTDFNFSQPVRVTRVEVLNYSHGNIVMQAAILCILVTVSMSDLMMESTRLTLPSIVMHIRDLNEPYDLGARSYNELFDLGYKLRLPTNMGFDLP